MPSAWRPADYASLRPFRDPRQRFGPPVEGTTQRSRDEVPGTRWRSDDPGNLPGVALSWLHAKKVARAMDGLRTDDIARELGLSASKLEKMLGGDIRFEVEYVAALAEKFGPGQILPTARELGAALGRITPTDPALRRGRAYGRGPRGASGKNGQFADIQDVSGMLEPVIVNQDSYIDPALGAAERMIVASVLALAEKHLNVPGKEFEPVAMRFWHTYWTAERPEDTDIALGSPDEDGVITITLRALDLKLWYETVYRNDLALIENRFVGAILEAGDDPRQPRKVRALYLIPENGQGWFDGRMFDAEVSWLDEIPTLEVVLDDYTIDVIDRIKAAGDPLGILHLFP